MSPAARWVIAVLALVTGLLALDRVTVARTSVRIATGFAVDELGRLAGVRDPTGRLADVDPLPVAVVQEGGPLWVQDELEAAVAADGGFRAAEGPHVLRVEVIATDDAVALRPALWRRGWSVGLPAPIVAWSAPWIAVVAAALGALAVARGLGVGVGLALAGALAQLGSTWPAWPVPSAAPELSQRWASGPVATVLRHLGERLPDSATAIGVAVIAACLVLIVFDHRRSRGRGGRLVLAGVLGLLGCVAWLEAAVRLGAPGLVMDPWGVLALVGMLGVWWTATPRRAEVRP